MNAFANALDDGPLDVPDPVAQRHAVWTAAVPARGRTDSDFRHHGYHQSGPWQLLHGWGVPGVVAINATGQSVACNSGRHRIVGAAGHCAGMAVDPAAVSSRSSATSLAD